MPGFVLDLVKQWAPAVAALFLTAFAGMLFAMVRSFLRRLEPLLAAFEAQAAATPGGWDDLAAKLLRFGLEAAEDGVNAANGVVDKELEDTKPNAKKA